MCKYVLLYDCSKDYYMILILEMKVRKNYVTTQTTKKP